MWILKITYSLLTSFLLCLRRPSMRSFWASLWLRRWRWSLFIPIGSLAVLFFSFLSPPYSSQVHAASLIQGVSPSPTWIPLFTSPTPAPTQDYSCNGTQPSGWGTVTPDMTWYLNCSNCITPAGLETSTPAVTGTPPAITATPLAVTATSTPSSGLVCGTNNVGGICSEVAPGVVGGYFMYENDISQPYNNGGADAHLHVQGSPSLPSGTLLYVTFYTSSWAVSSNYSADRLVDTFIDDSVNPAIKIDDDLLLPEYGMISSELLSPYMYTVTTGLTNVSVGVTFYNYSNRSGSVGSYVGSGDFTVYVSMDGYYLPPPPPSSGYCGSVVPEGGGENPCELGVFCLPGPGIGPTVCPVDIPEITIPLGVLGWEDIVFPHVKICFTEINFGSMIVWGVTLDLDYFAYILAAAAVIKILTRS